MKVKEERKIFHTNGNQKRPEVAILIRQNRVGQYLVTNKDII